ncbi:MAG: hypothetical protein NWF05_03030 [Candidatus Bathyarchaeota archaeon]|nr:hypothetical protein [Candidatus Bathyarchaeota archaeon]
MAIEVDTIIFMLIGIVVNVVVNSLFVWLAGRALVGGEKAKFTDAVWIVVLGSIINGVIGAFFYGIVGSIITFILWLGLIKHFFDCGWGKAFIIAVVAIIIQFILSFIIALIFGAAIYITGI